MDSQEVARDKQGRGALATKYPVHAYFQRWDLSERR